MVSINDGSDDDLKVKVNSVDEDTPLINGSRSKNVTNGKGDYPNRVTRGGRGLRRYYYIMVSFIPHYFPFFFPPPFLLCF